MKSLRPLLGVAGVLLPLVCGSPAWAEAKGTLGATYPDTDRLWALPRPPFRITAEEPRTALSEFRNLGGELGPGQGGVLEGTRDFLSQVASGLSSADYANARYPLPLKPPVNPSQQRLAELQNAASLAASRYASIKLRGPALKVEDGHFRALLVGEAGGAAAFYGQAVLGALTPLTAFQRWVVDAGDASKGIPDKREFYLILGEDEMYGNDLKVFPAKGALSMAHELFHAIQARYPTAAQNAEGSAHAHKWISEGLPDAIATWASEGVAFGGERGFDFVKSLRSGSTRYGKVLGLRPYDYPLDLSAVPLPSMKIQPKNTGAADVRELGSYMTSSFWRYVFEEAPRAGTEWTALHAALRQPKDATAKSPREQRLLWANEAVKLANPAFGVGLYRAFPAFIAHRAQYPDQVMNSRQGVFAHPTWLEYMFQDEGCPLITLSEAKPNAPPVDLTIRPLAAKCLRLKWVGARHASSGAPTATVTAVPLNAKDLGNAIESIHLGHHKVSEGFLGRFIDQASQKPVRVFQPLDLDPDNPSKTNNEVVVTFTNVAKDVLKTVQQQYQITIAVNVAQVQGQVTKPSPPDGSEPASTGRTSGTRRAFPGRPLVGSNESGEISVGGAGGVPEVDALYDCFNALSKQSTVGALSFINKVTEKPVSEGPPASCAVMNEILSPAFKMKYRNQMGISLSLPRVPSGTRGAIKGGVVHVAWSDPALRDLNDGDVGGSTELVNVIIAEATETYVRGGFSARFTEDLHGLVGTVSGDFLQTRADTNNFEASTDPMDMMSSDALLAMQYAGMSREQMDQMARASRAAAAEAGAAASRGSSSGGSTGVLEPPPCNCDCAEFDSPRRDACAPQCLSYGAVSGQCVVDREIGKGRKRADVLKELDACPLDCPTLRGNVSKVCADVAYGIRQACLASGASGVTRRQIDCYLDYVVRDAEEPQRSEFRRTQAEQIAAMDPDTRDQFMGAILTALKAEGINCLAR